MDSIKFHNTEISANVLAQFIDYGKTESGSRAAQKTAQEMFLHSLQSKANYIEDIINESSEGRTLIKELVTYNFNNVDQFPKLRFSKLSNVDMTAFAIAIEKLVNAGLILPDEPTRQWVRQELDMPEEIESEEPEKPESPEQAPEIESRYKLKENGFWRKLTADEKRINIPEINKSLSGFRDNMVEIGDKHRAIMIKKMITEGEKLLVKNIGIKEFTSKLERFRVPNQGIFENELAKKMREVFQYSRDHVKEEMKTIVKLQDSLAEDQDEAKKAIRPFAMLSVSFLTMKLYNEWRKELTRQKGMGIVDSLALNEVLVSLTNNDFKREMREKVTEIFGFGRNSELKKHEDKIENFVRSEIMDQNTCKACLAVDGQEFKSTDSVYSDFVRGPYTRCEGHDLCRGLNIPR